MTTSGQLLDYCRRSANPVGRLMLALIRCAMSERCLPVTISVARCNSINFWRDAAVDASRGACMPQEDFRRLGLLDVNFPQHPSHRLLMQQQCERARDMMNSGTALLPYLAGRFRIGLRSPSLAGYGYWKRSPPMAM